MLHNSMRLRIHTITKTIYDDEVSSITIPTQLGQITILDHHEPLISILEEGEVIINNKKTADITGGVVEVSKDNTTTLLIKLQD